MFKQFKKTHKELALGIQKADNTERVITKDEWLSEKNKTAQDCYKYAMKCIEKGMKFYEAVDQCKEFFECMGDKAIEHTVYWAQIKYKALQQTS